MKRILVGYDGSTAAQNALAFGTDLADHYQAEVHVIAVAQPPDFADGIDIQVLIEQSAVRSQELLAQAAEQFPRHAMTLASRVGHPAEEILHYAAENQIDHIVLGHRGRSFFDRWLLGSVSRRVVAYADCTVTVTRPGDRH